MRLAKATLVSRSIPGYQNGEEVMKPEVPIGKTYFVDLDSAEECIFVNANTGKSTVVNSVRVIKEDGSTDGRHLLELLKVEES